MKNPSVKLPGKSGASACLFRSFSQNNLEDFGPVEYNRT